MLITKDGFPAQRLPGFKGGKGELLAHIKADGDNKILFGCLAPAIPSASIATKPPAR